MGQNQAVENTNFRLFIAALKKDGFAKRWDDRSKVNGRVAEYFKVVGERDVGVQLWSDGGHRVSHMLGGRMSTPPTPFADIDGMRAAVQHELRRNDHPPLQRQRALPNPYDLGEENKGLRPRSAPR
jgi:hypothetical protein